ncbi:hypothetical protein GCM10009676_42140 [Prauserella halophila]|uniref:Uncharacterized protein n=1 Tax=Prauserella halophila TaxID=185641 RepID=A0ABP4H7A5_9PSEU
MPTLNTPTVDSGGPAGDRLRRWVFAGEQQWIADPKQDPGSGGLSAVGSIGLATAAPLPRWARGRNGRCRRPSASRRR